MEKSRLPYEPRLHDAPRRNGRIVPVQNGPCRLFRPAVYPAPFHAVHPGDGACGSPAPGHGQKAGSILHQRGRHDAARGKGRRLRGRKGGLFMLLHLGKERPEFTGHFRHGIEAGVVPHGTQGKKEIRPHAGMRGRKFASGRQFRAGKGGEQRFVFFILSHRPAEGKAGGVLPQPCARRMPRPLVSGVGRAGKVHALYAETRKAGGQAFFLEHGEKGPVSGPRRQHGRGAEPGSHALRQQRFAGVSPPAQGRAADNGGKLRGPAQPRLLLKPLDVHRTRSARLFGNRCGRSAGKEQGKGRQRAEKGKKAFHHGLIGAVCRAFSEHAASMTLPRGGCSPRRGRAPPPFPGRTRTGLPSGRGRHG